MIRVRRGIAPALLAVLMGCGGSGTVSNAAHLRFFDALNDSSNVRLYVGGHLYSAGKVGPSIENGNDLAYGDVPSGTVSLVVNKYGNQNSGGDTSSLATLTSQTLLSGRNYTAVALLTGTTKKLVLYSDNSTLSDQQAYFRIVNANNTTTPLYLSLVTKTDGSFVYETSSTAGLASGSTTGLQSNYTGSDTEGADYVLHVYSDSAFTNEIASTTMTLTPGKAVTTFIYNKTAGAGLSFKSSTDQDTNVTTTTTPTTTSTTATTGTTAG